MTEINYQELLIKYMAHVIICEGTDFVSPSYRSKFFTETEWAILEYASENSVKLYTGEL